MNQNEMIQNIRAEIVKLQRVLDLLLNQPGGGEQGRRAGRPKASGNRANSLGPEEAAPKKRTMSAEGKARIAAAQKKRWATQKAVASDRNSRKEAPSAKRAGKRVPLTDPKKLASLSGTRQPIKAGKRPGSAQVGAQVSPKKRTAPLATRKGAAKKSVAKTKSMAKTVRQPATKRPVKQAATAGSDPQTTA